MAVLMPLTLGTFTIYHNIREIEIKTGLFHLDESVTLSKSSKSNQIIKYMHIIRYLFYCLTMWQIYVIFWVISFVIQNWGFRRIAAKQRYQNSGNIST